MWLCEIVLQVLQADAGYWTQLVAGCRLGHPGWRVKGSGWKEGDKPPTCGVFRHGVLHFFVLIDRGDLQRDKESMLIMGACGVPTAPPHLEDSETCMPLCLENPVSAKSSRPYW